MKIWTLVWLLTLPPNDAGQVEFEIGSIKNLTEEECQAQLAEDDLKYILLAKEGLVTGHVLSCKLPPSQ
jgi:hypothetical protein